MSSWLVVYERRTGRRRLLRRYSHSSEALSARFEEEDRLAPGEDVEVVVLTSDSLETLRRTHRRYFEVADRLPAV